MLDNELRDDLLVTAGLRAGYERRNMYKKIEVMMPINTWANRCGYFYNAHFDKAALSTPNNGYNCRHPECAEVDENGVGCCFAWGCPLCYEADEEDCEAFGVESHPHISFVVVLFRDFDNNEFVLFVPLRFGIILVEAKFLCSVHERPLGRFPDGVYPVVIRGNGLRLFEVKETVFRTHILLSFQRSRWMYSNQPLRHNMRDVPHL